MSEEASDYSAEFAAEDEAIERIGSDLAHLRAEGVSVSDIEIESVKDTLRRQPGPYIGKDFSVLGDPEKIWKVVRRAKGSADTQRAA